MLQFIQKTNIDEDWGDFEVEFEAKEFVVAQQAANQNYTSNATSQNYTNQNYASPNYEVPTYTVASANSNMYREHIIPNPPPNKIPQPPAYVSSSSHIEANAQGTCSNFHFLEEIPQFNCPYCTSLNPIGSTICDVCNSPFPSTAATSQPANSQSGMPESRS